MLRLTRGKNAKKGQLVRQKMNMMTGSVFMLMMTVNWQVILVVILETNKESEDEGSDSGLKT